MDDFSHIHDSWVDLFNIKEEIAFGDTSLDLEEYKYLVKKTYYLIKNMHKHIASGDYSDVTPDNMREYIDLISAISMYSTSLTVDESTDLVFTVSRLLAFDLADLGCNYSYYEEDEDYEAMDGEIVSIEGHPYGLDKEIRYDVNAGDLSDYYELARKIFS